MSLPSTIVRRALAVLDTTVSCHVYHTYNIGDLMCCPLEILARGASVNKCNVETGSGIDQISGRSVIFGGGGLLYKSFPGTMRRIIDIVRQGQGAVIGWGLGSNTYGERETVCDNVLDDFDLVGIRDYGTTWAYVPCCSCLLDAFNEPADDPEGEAVVYEHYKYPIRGLPDFPRMTNWIDAAGIGSVLRFLSSGEVVITNSYHGAYWALLLGRKVVIHSPFSSKFFGLGRPVAICDDGSWKTCIQSAVAYDDFLPDCRQRNLQFAEKVFNLL